MESGFREIAVLVGLFAISTHAGVAQLEEQRRKGFSRSYVGKYRCTTGLGAEKFEASSAKEMVRRHLWHPSIGAMTPRLGPLAAD